MEPSRRIALVVGGSLLVAALVVAGRWGWGAWQARAITPLRPTVALVSRVAGGQRGMVVEVINATGREGLARQVTRLLREQGVDVVYFGSSDRRPDSTTVMVRRGGDQELGRVVARITGTKRIAVEPDSTRRVDLTVMLGADFRFPTNRLPL